MTPTAQMINDHLLTGGPVAVKTYTKVTWYRRIHAGYFTQGKDGNLYVKYGRKGKNCLTFNKGQNLLVGIYLYPPLPKKEKTS